MNEGFALTQTLHITKAETRPRGSVPQVTLARSLAVAFLPFFSKLFDGEKLFDSFECAACLNMPAAEFFGQNVVAFK